MNRMCVPIFRLLLMTALALPLLAASSAAFAQELGGNKPPRDRSPNGSNADEQDKSSDSLTRAELKKRFEARFDAINRLKGKGLIGETFDGWIEAVFEGALDGDQRDLLAVENADRKALYALIADRVDEQEKRVPPRVVAERNARRNFDRAEPDELLKVAEGYWIAKRDLARAERITDAKKAGDIGETWEGTLGVVNLRAGDDIKTLVQTENAARGDVYRHVAKQVNDGSPAEVGRAVGKSTRDGLAVGQYYQSKNGAWEKRPGR